MTDTRPYSRIEKDALGEVAVPAAAYWGAQTQRSLANFPFPPAEAMPMGIVLGLVQVKRAAASVHRASGALDAPLADAIIHAADRVLSGEFADQFPLTIWQTGSGTQSNMNVNEVLAGIANEALAGTRGGKSPVHPNDHVNKGQSSNDSFPTAIHIAVATATHAAMLPALARLEAALLAKSAEWADIVKIGRTHLQDATPVTLGQEFSAFAAQIAACRARIAYSVEHDVQHLAQGGTAVGTGLNAPNGFAEAMAQEIIRATGIVFTPAPNLFEALASHDALISFSGTLNTLAVALTKIGNDIRLLGSGPRSGLGELILPVNEPGSSIMPGKINPTQCEMLTMVAAQVMGNHTAVTIGGLQGHLQLNVFKPLIGANVLRSVVLLATAMTGFAAHCVEGLQPDRARIAELLERSLMLVTALVPLIGYDTAAAIALTAHRDGLTLREAAMQAGVTAVDYDAHVRPADMV